MLKKIISNKDEAMLQQACHSELYASHLYRHLANQLQRLGYFGAQKFFAGESADELTHYQKHADFLNDSGTVAQVPMIEAMDERVTALRDAIEIAYETELQLGHDYARWHDASADATVKQHLLQFLEIQRKSVGEFGDLLARLDRAGANEAAILMIDSEMGA